ncbi:MAG: inorganic diphosphatase [Rickettsiaceae bacterium]|nr:inorganic diphosphatase [Rickettsiaceae bacterium]
MNINKISPGQNAPEEINVIVEIPMNSDPVKYEVDKDTGALFVDRFMQVAMSYPCNYGFVPNTLGGDGDPIDVLVVSLYPAAAGSVIRCRPVGVLMMEDESGQDEKIIAVPVAKVDVSMENIKTYSDLNPYLLKRIIHFFETYKDLEQGKWVKILGWKDIEKAKNLITCSIERAKTYPNA